MNTRLFIGMLLLWVSTACTDHLYQNSLPLNNRRTVVQGDTLQSFTVTADTRTLTARPDKYYAWYLRNNLGYSQGGYEGALLDGLYTKMLRDNTLLEKGQFQQGLKDGEWMYWHPNGTIAVTKQWDQGKAQGSEQTYNDKGGLRESQQYRKGELHGEETIHLPFLESKTKTRHLRTWKAGALTGPYVIYDSLDQVHEEGSYRNGKQDGKITTYQRFTDEHHNTTVVQQVHTYRTGQPHGAFTERYPNGHVQREGKYKHGILHGKVTSYEPAPATHPSSGQPQYRKQVYSWKNEQYNGPFAEYGADGKPLKKGNYQKGQLHGKLTTWNKEGEKTVQHYEAGVPVEKQKLVPRLKSLIKQKKNKEEVTENLPE